MYLRDIVALIILKALSNSKSDNVALLREVVNSHNLIQRVAYISSRSNNYFTVWVRYKDGSQDAFNFMYGKTTIIGDTVLPEEHTTWFREYNLF